MTVARRERRTQNSCAAIERLRRDDSSASNKKRVRKNSGPAYGAACYLSHLQQHIGCQRLHGVLLVSDNARSLSSSPNKPSAKTHSEDTLLVLVVERAGRSPHTCWQGNAASHGHAHGVPSRASCHPLTTPAFTSRTGTNWFARRPQQQPCRPE